MSSQPLERHIPASDLSAQLVSLPDLLRALLDLSRQAREASSEADLLRAAAAFLLHTFQVGRVELRLVGAAAGVVAATTADGSVTVLPLPPAADAPTTLSSAKVDLSASAFPLLSALLQDAEETLGSIALLEPRDSAFAADQRVLLPLLAEYLVLLLRDWR